MRLPRIVVTALAGLMVLLLVIVPSNPASAVGDTLYGEKANFQSELFTNKLPLGVDCTGQGWWIAHREGGLINYRMKFVATNCNIMRPGNPPNSGDRQKVSIAGINDAGQCTSTGWVDIARKDGDLFSANWEETSTEISMGWADDPTIGGTPPLPGLGGICVPTDIRHMVGSHVDGWRAPIDLGDLPDFGVDVPDSHTATTCSIGTPSGAHIDRVEVKSGSTHIGWKYDVTVTWRGAGATGTWNVVGATANPGWAIGDPRISASQRTIPLGTFGVLTGQNTATFSTPTQSDATDALTRVGLQIYTSSPSLHAISNTTLLPGPQAPSDTWGWGITDPSKCFFWVGPKAYNDAASTKDEPWVPGYTTDPIGSETEPTPTDDHEPVVDPTAPDEQCEFDILDPGSWLDGGMCALVGLMGKLLDVLIGIFNAVVGLPAALLNMLGGLFVPDQATLEATGSSMKTAWQDSSVGTFAEDFAAVPEAFSPSSGSCAGPTIPIHQAGVDIDWKPMNSCSGTGSTVAGLSRAIITVSVLIGTAYAILRLLGAALGLNLNGIGKGDD